MNSSGEAWLKWFERAGAEAGVDLVNATARLVIAEREIYAQEKHKEVFNQFVRNLDTLLRAIEAACHAWNQTPGDKRTEELQKAIDDLSFAHQSVSVKTPEEIKELFA